MILSRADSLDAVRSLLENCFVADLDVQAAWDIQYNIHLIKCELNHLND